MAHRVHHRKVTGWIPETEAQALERLAKENERSLAAELRIAIRAHLEARSQTAEATA